MREAKDIPMRVVKQKTGLTSRQIRYYDQVNLIFPERSAGNQRLFSEEDIEKLKKIRRLINQGYNINSIRKRLNPPIPVESSRKKTEFVTGEKLKKKYKKNRLRSLYPVSNRSYLTRVLQQQETKK